MVSCTWTPTHPNGFTSTAQVHGGADEAEEETARHPPESEPPAGLATPTEDRLEIPGPQKTKHVVSRCSTPKEGGRTPLLDDHRFGGPKRPSRSFTTSEPVGSFTPRNRAHFDVSFHLFPPGRLRSCPSAGRAERAIGSTWHAIVPTFQFDRPREPKAQKPQDFEFSPTTSPRPALSPQHPPPIGRQVTTASLEDVGSPAARRGGRGVDGSSDQRKAPEKNHRRERSEILHVHGSSVRFTDGRPKRCFSLAPLCNTLAPAG